MSRKLFWVAALLATASVGCSSADDSADQLLQLSEPVPFTNFPVCEASASAIAGTADGPAILLVGDNEVRTSLFGYSLTAGVPDAASQKRYDFPDAMEISDIEAIASLGDGRFAVFGSHSRNSRCDAKGPRRRFMIARLSSDAIEIEGELVQSEKITCERLFGNLADDPHHQTICETIETAEDAADEIDDLFDKSDGGDNAQGEAEVGCSAASPFNLEGSFAVDSRVWVGLRSPLVNASAVLLRLAGASAFSFDRAVLLDLEGRGVRDLTVANGMLWGIAGPPADSNSEFSLWKLPLTALESDGPPQPEIVRRLPTSSEALWIEDGRAHVLIDGDKGDSSCHTPVHYWSDLIDGVLEPR